MKPRPVCFLLPILLCPLFAAALDSNNNQQSDVWEMAWGATGLPAAGDADGDGFTNAQESAAGTNPLSALDFPVLDIETAEAGTFNFSWHGVEGKKYALLASPNLAAASWLSRLSLSKTWVASSSSSQSMSSLPLPGAVGGAAGTTGIEPVPMPMAVLPRLAAPAAATGRVLGGGGVWLCTFCVALGD